MVKMISRYKPNVKSKYKTRSIIIDTNFKTNLGINVNKSHLKNQSSRWKMSINNEEVALKDPNQYLSIENLPLDASLGGSASLKKLIKQATKNHPDIERDVDNTNERDSDNDASEESFSYSSYNDFESEEEEGGTDDYNSDTFD